jgi:hypothetical protein
METIREKVLGWPRWLLWGLISGGAGLIIINIFLFIFSIDQSPYIIGPIVVLDFLLGAFLERKVKDLKEAVAVWIVANIALLVTIWIAIVIVIMFAMTNM